MDDLDKEFFGSNLKRRSALASVTKAQTVFDEDDPLGDLLSASDENSPEKIVSKPLATKDSSDVPKPSKNKLIADLFGLHDQEESSAASIKPANKVEDPGDWLGLKAESDSDHKGNSRLKFDENLPLEPHSLSKVGSKEDEFLSAVGSKESFKSVNRTNESSSKVSSATQRKVGGGETEEPKNTSSILSSFISDFDSKPVHKFQQTMKGQETSGRFERGKDSYMPSVNRESRRSTRRRVEDVADPLGLFSSLTNTQGEGSSSKKAQGGQKDVEPSSLLASKVSRVLISDQVPQWLGGSSTAPPPSVKTQNFSASTMEDRSDHEDIKPATGQSTVQSDADIIAGLANLEMQAGEAVSQQQKSFITALALKRQEDVLLKLQAQQSALLAQHEQQLGALVQRQVQRQQQMMRQQEQIQAHIQALMIQPPPIPPITLPSSLWTVDESLHLNHDFQVRSSDSSKNQNGRDLDSMSELKSQVLKLEIENQDLKSQLENDRQRHEGNLADVENIFRRQILFQEESMVKQEKRYLSEIDSMEKEAASRINRLKDEHSEASRQQAQRMAQLHGEWLADLQRLGEFHQQAVEMLRAEQASTIEHWKNLQVAEIAAVKEANSNARLLETAVNHLQESTESLMNFKKEIKTQAQCNLSEKQDSILKQEVQLSSLREALEKQAASLDAERQALSIMSRDLESHLMRRQQEVTDERNRFEAREKNWEREKLGAIEHLDQEKKHLEKLQLQAQSELVELGERKLALAAEVARLETTLHIQNTNANRNSQQAEQMVAEARSTLEAAQEAGNEVQKEREEIMALKHKVSAEQNRLGILERGIQSRERKIEEEIVKAQAFKREGMSALEEARRLERERTEHASDLAQRLLHLKEREDRLAQEKLAITMEWKRIQELRIRTDCSHCGRAAVANISSFNSTQNIVDPLPIIMKLEAEQGLDFVSLDHPKYHHSLFESVSQ